MSETGTGTGTVTTTGCVAEDQNNSSSSNNNNIVPSPSVNKKLVSLDSVSKLGLYKTCKQSLKMDWKTNEFVKLENIHLIKTVNVKNNKVEEQIKAEEDSLKIENTSNLTNQIQNETDELDLSLTGLTDGFCGTEADISDLRMGLGTDNMMHIINRDHANVINDIYADGLNNIDMDGTGTDVGVGTISGNNGGDISVAMTIPIPTSFINGTGGEIGSLKNLCETIVGGKDGENNTDKSDSAASAPSVSESGAPDLKTNLESVTNNTLDEPKVSEMEPTSVDIKPEIVEQPTKRKRSMDIGITIPKKITGKSCRLNLHAAIVREQALLVLHLDSIENKLKELETPKLGDPRALLNKLKDLEDLKKEVQLINGKIEFMRNIRPDHNINQTEAQLSCTDVTAAAAAAAAADSIVPTPVSVPAE